MENCTAKMAFRENFINNLHNFFSESGVKTMQIANKKREHNSFLVNSPNYGVENIAP